MAILPLNVGLNQNLHLAFSDQIKFLHISRRPGQTKRRRSLESAVAITSTFSTSLKENRKVHDDGVTLKGIKLGSANGFH
jgi:hypothetical protein